MQGKLSRFKRDSPTILRGQMIYHGSLGRFIV